MCSFLVTNRTVSDVENVNYYLKFRGPDHTEVFKQDGWTFVHNLLSITGSFTPQPLQKNGVVLVFNGEIYNYNDSGMQYESDGYFILDQYFEKGIDFVKELDGEFALVLLDFNKNILFFSGDSFLTKPLYLAVEDREIGLASLPSALSRLHFDDHEIVRVTPNTVYRLDLNEWKLTHQQIVDWNLEQTVDSFDPWIEAFTNSVAKRTNYSATKILVPMSSGYDSGAIVAQLKRANYSNFLTYSFTGNEDLSIIKERIRGVPESIVTTFISEPHKRFIRSEFDRIVQPFSYGQTPRMESHNGFDDKGAIGLFSLLQEVKQSHGIKVQLSGQGGDEITGNLPSYGFNSSNPRIWPDNLESVFPWGNFYYGANWSYLNKEECIAGSLGIETRYPLLDKAVVQAFLNLTPALKNRHYKAPIRALFDKYEFPFKEEKLGFNLEIR